MTKCAETQLHYFADSLVFGLGLASHLGLPSQSVGRHCFPDGESLVRVASPVAKRAILVRSLHDPNDKLVEVLLAADALRRAGAEFVDLVAPYLPYMRQDSVFTEGEPNSQQVVGGLLAANFDSITTVEAHLHRVAALSEVAGSGARSLSSAPAICEWVQHHAPGALIVGPDVESTPWVEAIASTADLPYVVGEKTRRGDVSVEIEFPRVAQRGRAVIVDDIASSGVTLAAAATSLRRAGIRDVSAVVVHAIFAAGAMRRIREAGVRDVVSSDTVPHESNGYSTTALVAEAIQAPPQGSPVVTVAAHRAAGV